MRTVNHGMECVRRACQLLIGPVVFAMVITGCGSSGNSSGKGGSTSSGGSVGSGGSTGNGGSGGSGSGGANGGGSGGSSATTGAGGSATGGSSGSATGGHSGSPAGGSPAGGSPALGGSSAGGSGAGGIAAGGKGGTQTGGSTTSGIDGGSAGAGGGGGGSTGGVTVQLDQKHQTVEGFGLNTALGGGTVPWDTFYGTSGLGFSIVRVAMDSGGKLNGSVPAKSYNAKVIGSAWTAPANCKDNNSENNGGHLLTSCYDSWSTTIANFAQSQGLYAMSVANEPEFASCGSNDPCNGTYSTMLYTAKEMVAFLKVAGPKIQQAGAKVIAPETSEWLHLWSNISAGPDPGGKNSSDPLKCGCFGMTIDSAVAAKCAATCTQGNGGYDYGHAMAADTAAWAAVDIIGTHEYDSQQAYAWPSDVNGGKRDKEVWQTEMSGVKWWPEQGPSSDIANGIAVAGWVHSALVVGEASAWLYWWYQAGGTNDNEGLVLQNSTAVTKRAYTIGNYSKFVKPGYVMVSVTGNSSADLLLSAFTGTDGTVIVGINKGKDVSVPITIAGGTAPASCTPNVTSASDNLKAGTAVTVTDGVLTAAFTGSTVTTFVCK